MSRRRRKPAAGASAPFVDESQQERTDRLPPVTLAHLLLLGCAFLLVSLAGGTPGDRPPISIQMPGDPQPAGLLELVGTPAALVLAALVFARTFASALSLDGSRRLRDLAPSIFALALLAWCGLSALFAEYRDPAIHMLALTTGTVMFGFAVGRMGREPAERAALLGILVGVPALVSVIGLNEYIRNTVGGNPAWRVFATFANQDFLAGYLLFSIPAALALVLTAERRHVLLASGAALLLQLACLLLTQSRLGLAAMLAALALFALTGAVIQKRCALPPWTRKRALAIALLALVIAAAAAGPVIRRIGLARTESYSARFRLLTWQGTAAMARSHPLLGTGLGTFPTSYPRYARVGYTAHAHNTYLQFAAEAGYPALLLLFAVLLAALAAGWRGLLAGGKDGLITAGVFSGLVGALIHNATDSDLYLPANMLALALSIGLLVSAASARGAPASLDQGRPRAQRWIAARRAVVLLSAMALAAHALLVAAGRVEARRAEESLAAGDGTGALNAARAAVGFDGDNADYQLRLARIYELSGQPAAAERAYLSALASGRVGRAARLYGRFLMREGRLEQAVAMHEQAVRWEPLNLQSLLALAQAQQAAGRLSDAETTFRRMAALYDQPVAQVRAIPELVETEYAEAFLALADFAIARNEKQAAEGYLRRACDVLEAFRQSARLQIAEIKVAPEMKRSLLLRYESALERRAALLAQLGREEERTATLERLRELRSEIAEEARRASQAN